MTSIKVFITGIVTMLLISLCISCTNDDYFGSSTWNEIKEFTVPGQSGATVISKENNTVTLSVGNGVDRTELTPATFEISNFASVNPGKAEAQDFTDPVEYVVRAENGGARTWTVTIDEIGENPQLSNSDFNLWYETATDVPSNPKPYFQPGESKENTIWATANEGVTLLNLGEANTTPVDMGGIDFAAKLETTDPPSLSPPKVKLAAATLFTGIFIKDNIDIDNPRAATDFGIAFTSRPSAFRVNYAYLPGENNIVVAADECDIYVLLEKRDGDSVARIGTGWFRDGTDTGTNQWTVLEQEIKYGELTSSDPEFEYANIREGETWADPDETPTHISVVFSSSARGDFYEGAIGSVLYVDDFELIYD